MRAAIVAACAALSCSMDGFRAGWRPDAPAASDTADEPAGDATAHTAEASVDAAYGVVAGDATDATRGDAAALDGGDVDAVPAPPARLLSPLSGQTVTVRRPALCATAGGAPELSSRRAFVAAEEVRFTEALGAPTGRRCWRPTVDLSPGVYFWRVAGAAGGVREFRVPRRPPSGDGATESSWGTLPDFDGDGLADLAVSASDGVRVYGASAGSPAPPRMTAFLPARGDDYGRSVAAAGDVNGDGFVDLVVAGNNHIYVHAGGSGGPASEPLATVGVALTPNDTPVAGAGDLDGDGFADLVAATATRLLFFRGGADGPAPSPADDWRLSGAGAIRSVRSAGDFNGDGREDVVLGAASSSQLGAPPFVVLLRVPGDAATRWFPVSITVGSDTMLAVGQTVSVACAGDVNADGRADVVVGAGVFPTGLVAVVTGRPFDLRAGGGATLPVPPGAAGRLAGIGNASFGSAVAGAGDVDGDGLDDVLVGAPLAHLVTLYRAPRGASWAPPDRLSGPLLFGSAVAGLGDIDGDGASEFSGASAAAVSFRAWRWRDRSTADGGVAWLPWLSSPSPAPAFLGWSIARGPY